MACLQIYCLVGSLFANFVVVFACVLIYSGACTLARQRSNIAKQIWQPIDLRDFGCAPVRTDSGGGGGEFQDNPGGGECHFFLLGNRVVKSRGAFGQPAFF